MGRPWICVARFPKLDLRKLGPVGGPWPAAKLVTRHLFQGKVSQRATPRWIVIFELRFELHHSLWNEELFQGGDSDFVHALNECPPKWGLTHVMKTRMILSYYLGGVPMKMNKTRRAVTISMPKDMAEQYDNLAKRLAKNRSVLFREMFLAYKRQALEKEFREIQTYGAQLARKKGLLTEADVEKLVFEGR